MPAQIEALIETYLADDDPRLGWVREAVRVHRFLPVYLGLTVALGIAPDGSVVRWAFEDAPDLVEPEPEGLWQRVALCEGAKKYPVLRPLVPARPAGAETCPACNGTGSHPLSAVGAGILCGCGGTGWILPGEGPGTSPG